MRARRGGSTVRLAGAGLAVLLAAAGATAYLVVDHTTHAPLPTSVVGTQTIALVNPGAAGPGAWQGTGQAPATLLAAGGRLTLSADAQPGAGWTADQMAGGTYIFIYLANGGLCLTAPAAPVSSAQLQPCDLQASQRWLRQGQTPGPNGLTYWQLRNQADGLCLGAGSQVSTAAQQAGNAAASQDAAMQACEGAPSWRQLVTFVQSS
jgi:Ricin-type beta-trefoil lectin domain-like